MMFFDPNQNDGFIPYNRFKQWNTGIEGSTYLSPEDDARLKNLYESTRKEVCNNDPSHLTKFATCKIVYDKTGEIGEFIEDAKRLYSIKIEQSFDENDRFEIFSINNRFILIIRKHLFT